MINNRSRADIHNAMARIHKACGRRWEGHLLLELELTKAPPVGPGRLAGLVSDASGAYLSPNEASRQLRTMTSEGLVRNDTATNGYSLYGGLTPPGQNRLTYLMKLAEADLESHEPRSTSPNIVDFAQEWLSEIGTAAAVTMMGLDHKECLRVLSLLAQDIVAAVTARQFDPNQGCVIGARLVTAGFRDPGVLGSTISAIIKMLPPPRAANRTARLIERIAVGFVSALRDATLHEHEAFCRTTCSLSSEPPHRVRRRPTPKVHTLD